MRLNRSQLIALGLVLLAALWFVSGLFVDPPPRAGDEREVAQVAAPRPAPTVRVRTQAAEDYVREVHVRGRTEALRTIEVKAETAGRVIAIEAEKGAALAAGALIVKLAPDDRPARLAEMRALAAHREREYQAATNLSRQGFRAEIQLAAARAELEAARAALARIELDLANTEIRAPIAGILDGRPVEVGDYLAVGDKVATVVDLDTIRIVGSVSERDIALVKPGAAGQAVLVTGERLEGWIAYVGTVADPATRTFRVEVEAPNPGRQAKAGVTAELRLPVQNLRAHRVTPAILTLDEGGTIGVKTVEDGGRVKFLPVHIIADSSEVVWIAGLPETVTFITVGQEFVADGQAITPVAEKADGST